MFGVSTGMLRAVTLKYQTFRLQSSTDASQGQLAQVQVLAPVAQPEAWRRAGELAPITLRVTSISQGQSGLMSSPRKKTRDGSGQSDAHGVSRALFETAAARSGWPRSYFI